MKREQEGETCVNDNDKSCDSGLQCGTCTGNVTVPHRCTRVQPHNPLSKVYFIESDWLCVKISLYKCLLMCD